MKNPRNNNGISPKKNAGVLHGKTLLIAAGGTGGHISPGVSVAEAWLAESGSVLFATLQKNIDYPDIVRLARNEKAAIVAYDTPRLTKNPLQILNFFKRFFAAYRLLKRAARAERVDAVLGMGGYSSFPAVCFALFNRKPLFLCEQNARWGVVTRLGRFFARNIFLSFETQKPLSAKYRVTGNPLRAMFKGLVLSPIKKTRPQKKPLLFFLGGSQGATDINTLYMRFAESPFAAKYRITVATGPTQFESVKKNARKGDTILPFIEDMPQAYSDADTIVARCGSGTLFEILWAAKPAYLIPYPFAAANHQRANADAIKPHLNCEIFDERPFNAEHALVRFTAFLKNLPRTPRNPPEARAEEKIIRYIKESL